MHDDWERMRVHMPSILPITTSASPDNIMQTSARTNANLITLPGILDIALGPEACPSTYDQFTSTYNLRLVALLLVIY